MVPIFTPEVKIRETRHRGKRVPRRFEVDYRLTNASPRLPGAFFRVEDAFPSFPEGFLGVHSALSRSAVDSAAPKARSREFPARCSAREAPFLTFRRGSRP
jgi:hypothetical protein